MASDGFCSQNAMTMTLGTAVVGDNAYRRGVVDDIVKQTERVALLAHVMTIGKRCFKSHGEGE